MKKDKIYNKYVALINSKDFERNRLKYTSLHPYYSFLIKENIENLNEVSIDGLIKLIGLFKYYNSDFFNLKNIPVNAKEGINFEMNFNLSGDYKLDIKIYSPSFKESLIYCLIELSRLSNLYEIKKEDFSKIFYNEFNSLDDQKGFSIKETILEIKEQHLKFTENTIKYINRNHACLLDSHKKKTISFYKEIYEKILIL